MLFNFFPQKYLFSKETHKSTSRINNDKSNINQVYYLFQEAECQKSAMDVKYSTDTKIEDNARMFKLQKANFDQEINTAVSFYYFMHLMLICKTQGYQ